MAVPIRKLDPNSRSSSIQPQLDSVVQHFQQKFKCQPRFLVSVPGRVNLIGEHVDYSGFAVLPMAIQKHIHVAVGMQMNDRTSTTETKNGRHKNDDSANGQQQQQQKLNFANVRLINLDEVQFESFSFSDDRHLDKVVCPQWFHYFMCGYKGVMDSRQQRQHQELNNNHVNNKSNLAQILANISLNVAVLGDIPPSSGLSSSSALVCAAAIAVTHALDLIELNQSIDCLSDLKSIDKLKMATDCASFERYIGVQGGGMDQAIALLAEPGAAKLIEFYPQLSCQSVRLPNGGQFFVAHCGETLNKAATSQYNQRVLETRVAATLLKRHLIDLHSIEGQERHTSQACVTLGQVMREFGKSFKEMIQLVHQVLPANQVYTQQELLQVLRVDSTEKLADLVALPLQRIEQVMQQNGCMIGKQAGDQIQQQPESGFRLHERALHVYEEAFRVYQVQQLSETNALDDLQKLQQISQLMDDSHQSCSRLFECSSERLNLLVNKSKQAGALGSRLTGAGWGGCVVSLVPSDKTKDYLELIGQHSHFVFETCPGEGAVIYHLC